ncbi:hypothetical protein O2U01_10005 (plasmid) [Ligilactobacillus salivarius]|uniref:Uncharacterized protein n=1 Tax=Ligilactobacillus salivarius TaxID=1624 RepID=A0ABD7YYY7_9LACO|nr:hypothetical protein [Ligilactobacillus salivarius]WHS04953.1 hypothetical protein O2U07_00735 [Ligilactobacillus salivarius]WHS09041.1 hypothetical protein O2U05_11090 [Ligilactobacillus salivarius]WHS11261.1 hypothetical protein O2U04_10555 [Ligilactobacillus salivarius]WHS15120.1 hypothetical protein O2U03_10350 [Ligilactobacillus salivarius]WHS18745.1 hypothetical protein O2U02_09875 [Ligilactobacillus salivarius]
MARKKGYTSLNSYVQSVLRREIEDDLAENAKYIYEDFLKSIIGSLMNFEQGYVRVAERKKLIEKDMTKIRELTDDWLFKIDPDLEEFGETREIYFDEKTGIVHEEIIKKDYEKNSDLVESIKSKEGKVIKVSDEEDTRKSARTRLKSNKEIKIRGLDKNDIDGLKLIAKQSQYANLNQFMLHQVDVILQNGGLDIYENKLADDIRKIKEILSKIFNAQTQQELRDVKIIAKLDTNIESIIEWIKFMSLVETNQI